MKSGVSETPGAPNRTPPHGFWVRRPRGRQRFPRCAPGSSSSCSSVTWERVGSAGAQAPPSSSSFAFLPALQGCGVRVQLASELDTGLSEVGPSLRVVLLRVWSQQHWPGHPGPVRNAEPQAHGPAAGRGTDPPGDGAAGEAPHPAGSRVFLECAQRPFLAASPSPTPTCPGAPQVLRGTAQPSCLPRRKGAVRARVPEISAPRPEPASGRTELGEVGPLPQDHMGPH